MQQTSQATDNKEVSNCASVKERRGGWNRGLKTVDYSSLKRLCVLHLLKVMRSENPKDEPRKFKIALELTGKDIGKATLHQNVHNTVLAFHNLAKEVNGITSDGGIETGVSNALQAPRDLLGEGIGLKAMAEASGYHVIGEGQRQDDSQKL